MRTGALTQAEGAAAIQSTKDAFARQVTDQRARGDGRLTVSRHRTCSIRVRTSSPRRRAACPRSPFCCSRAGRSRPFCRTRFGQHQGRARAGERGGDRLRLPHRLRRRRAWCRDHRGGRRHGRGPVLSELDARDRARAGRCWPGLRCERDADQRGGPGRSGLRRGLGSAGTAVLPASTPRPAASASRCMPASPGRRATMRPRPVRTWATPTPTSPRRSATRIWSAGSTPEREAGFPGRSHPGNRPPAFRAG